METLPNDPLPHNADAVPVAPTTSTPTGATASAVPEVATIGVLHLINGEYYAGAERVQDLLALRLPEFGFQVGFACVKLDLFDELRESHAAPLYNVPMWSRFDLHTAWKVANLVRRGSYQIIHSHTVRTAMVGAIAAKLTGVPLVYHAHSPALYDTSHRWQNRVNSLVERQSLRGVARIIAVSEAIATHMIHEGFAPERVTVVHNGVPFPAWLPERSAPLDTWTLGVTALFRPRKGLEVLLEALAQLRQQGLPVRLRAVGDFASADYQAAIVEQIQRLGLRDYITWTGFTRDTAAELAQMDLFVLPSLYGEGLPMVVLEAMAAGVPVVATHVAGTPEAIRDGQDGLLVPPGNAAVLAQAIARVVRGEVAWESLRTNALARHALHFSDHGMAAGVAAVYREMLARV